MALHFSHLGFFFFDVVAERIPLALPPQLVTAVILFRGGRAHNLRACDAADLPAWICLLLGLCAISP